MASSAPSTVHIAAISQPAPMPVSRSATPGQASGRSSATAMTALATAPAAKTASSPVRVARQRVTSLAAYTMIRPGFWVSTVFQVPHWYSPPTASTPRMSMRAPRNTGRPPTELPTS
ncbi:hypothetical protein COUCH_13955 [Couchioplanes caeruleus]|nr:hypothetical protein [Couchioplanes caeruleus]UQU67298.1 hypothetical protein COUCH_13955 [Couchioplanes caeruleus]